VMPGAGARGGQATSPACPAERGVGERQGQVR
jgi:hypothetical protein